MSRFVMRYKRGQVLLTGEIEAKNLDRANDVGRRWCEINSARFILVEDPVLATEEILNTVPKDVSEEDKWLANSALERLAKMQNKTVEQVKDELKGKPAQAPTTVFERVKQAVGA